MTALLWRKTARLAQSNVDLHTSCKASPNIPTVLTDLSSVYLPNLPVLHLAQQSMLLLAEQIHSLDFARLLMCALLPSCYRRTILHCLCSDFL